jgi:hypothetical protein
MQYFDSEWVACLLDIPRQRSQASMQLAMEQKIASAGRLQSPFLGL